MRMKINGIMEWWNGGGLKSSSHHSNTPTLQHSNTPILRSPPPGFTLIELLAVVAIMSIILVAAIPMFQGMGKKDLGATGAQLRATLRLARQYAVTQRQNVYVVFPDNSANCDVADVDKLLRSYAVLAQPDSGVPTYEYLTEWRYLPPGVYFDDTPASGNIFVPQVNYYQPYDLPFPISSGADRSMPVIRFLPNGRAYTLNNAGAWNVINHTVYFTSSRFYNKNAAGTRLVSGPNIPGATNNVRVRGRTGQVEVRQDVGVN